MSHSRGRGGMAERAVERGTQAAVLVAGWKPLAIAGATLLLLIVLAGAITASIPAQCVEAEPQVTGTVQGVPKQYVDDYIGAAKRYRLGPRGPAILAAIHKIETNFGRSTAPGVQEGVNFAGCCAGPMQFYVVGPNSTWDAYGVDGNGDGRKDVYDPEDAIPAAARYLRASGAPKDWYRAIFAYNHAGWYVDDVLDTAKRFGDVGEIADVETPQCESPGVAGEANLNKAIRVYEPRRFRTLPRGLTAYGAPQAVDSRIWASVVWVLRSYQMRVTAAREPGHRTHGDGTAIDAIPARGSSIAIWNRTVKRAAEALGWRRSCAASGTAPACPIKPAIQFIGYNGFDPAHGDPAHSGSAHIHISWRSSSFGTSWGPPPRWVMVFPVPGGPTK